jgi:hypothetical protein
MLWDNFKLEVRDKTIDHCKKLANSKMAATTGHSIKTGPYGENTEIYSSLKLLH